MGGFLTEQHLRGNEFDLDEMRNTFGKMDEKFKNRGVSHAVLQSHHASLVGYRSYTERFVKDYGLDDEQVEAAMSILGEIEAQAKTHLASVKNQEDATSKRKEEAMRNAEWDQYRQLLKASRALNTPLTEFFGELKSRLDTIPTEPQGQAFREKLQSSKDPGQ